MPEEDLDGVWKALADPTRRAILDLLRNGPRTTTQIVEAFPQMTRFGVMKHMDVLRDAGLIHTREEKRQRINSLNVVPIRQIYERWVGRFEELWVSHLLRIKVLPAVHLDCQESLGAVAIENVTPELMLPPELRAVERMGRVRLQYDAIRNEGCGGRRALHSHGR